MAFNPRLPENAPFTPSQRAWLDGYIAGWFTFDVDMANERSLPHSPPAEPIETEDLPWHDPTLSLEERIALAEGRQPDRVLMAAMAQLDCGQCGYLCQTYAEAIARGQEKSLTRCAPGGKATSHKLKELIASGLDAKATTLPAMAASTPSRTPPSSSDKPFVAIFRGADCLNGPQSEKETRHVILASEDSPADYEVGDSLGVLARNSADLVTAIIERLGAKPDTPVPSPDGIERPLIEALSEACEIRRPSDQAIEVLASRALDRDESVVLQAMAEGYPGAGPEDADLLDLLEAFRSTRPPLSELISALDPLQPRLYSIASSPKEVGAEIHLAVAAVRYEKRARRRLGVASTFLSDRLVPGEPVRAFVRPAPGFRLPPSPETPIIMIGPGTGIAPFRAFLHERQAIKAPGRNWLFFGHQHKDHDFFYEDELVAMRTAGLLTRLTLAWSRDGKEKTYVQHRMREVARDLWAWINEGAHIYICGDALRMAKDVENALTDIVAEQSGRSAAEAAKFVADLKAQGRYQADVY